MKRIAVVILNWNGVELLEQFLPSIYKHTNLDEVDVIVADNGSTDNSVAFVNQHFPWVITNSLEQNFGFAEGYNKALANLDYEYVVLLNSDVEVDENWLSSAIEYLDNNKEYAALQPKILSYYYNPYFEYAGACGGFIDKYGYPFCRGRILNTVEHDYGQYFEPMDIFWASGACLFIRLKDFREVGGFDANFFAHQEEIDLCWRLNTKGKKIVCYPSSVVYHVGGATLHKDNPNKTYLNFRNNLLMLHKNLPAEVYTKTMNMRWFLDYLSAMHFVLKGQFSNALSVWKARRDFNKLKHQYNTVREQSKDMPNTVYTKSIIWQYYINKNKKYSQLK
ncbi:GT2 family glycosyltransferase [Dysgonomonadaceae bacterium PH5-43]|nr:GT2 family glycosyltransferase [Dysgonomonadaceae bacterium PH5-43]